MTTLACSKNDIWIMFWMLERMMIISTPFHLLLRTAVLAALVTRVADSVVVEFCGKGAVGFFGVDVEPTKLFWARVFIVSRGYVCDIMVRYRQVLGEQGSTHHDPRTNATNGSRNGDGTWRIGLFCTII